MPLRVIKKAWQARPEAATVSGPLSGQCAYNGACGHWSRLCRLDSAALARAYCQDVYYAK